MKRVRVKNCKKPIVKLPKLICDQKIHPHLDEFPLTQLMNKSFSCLLAGKAGSGKTSLLIGLLTTPKLFKKVFDKIFLFMPPNSRASIDNSIFDCLPEDQVFDELNIDTLSRAFSSAEASSKKDQRTLIIFDDVQNFFKGECEKLITHMISNRRHNRLSMFFVAQTYKKVPRSCRLGMSDLFCFRLSKSDMDDIKKELIDINDAKWEEIMLHYHQTLKKHPRTFLYINPSTNRVFFDWDEVKYDSDDVSSDDSDETPSFKRQRSQTNEKL